MVGSVGSVPSFIECVLQFKLGRKLADTLSWTKLFLKPRKIERGVKSVKIYVETTEVLVLKSKTEKKRILKI